MLYPKPDTRMVDTFDQAQPVSEIILPLWTYDPQFPNLHKYSSHEATLDGTRRYLGCIYIKLPSPVVCRLFVCEASLEIYQTPIPALQVQPLEWSLGPSNVITQQHTSNRQTWNLRMMDLSPIDSSGRFTEPGSSDLKSDKLIILDVKDMTKRASTPISPLEFDEISGQLFFFVHIHGDHFRVGCLDFV